MIRNTNIINFIEISDDKYGSLVAIEASKTAPFNLRRVYYIYGVPLNERRGFHSHNDLEQVLICVNGSVMIHVSTPYESEDILLDSPSKGLYIGPMVWREMYDFSTDAVLLVLASEYYDEEDYIRNHDEYIEVASRYFSEIELDDLLR